MSQGRAQAPPDSAAGAAAGGSWIALAAGKRAGLEVLSRAGGFLLSVLVARQLGVELFGRYALALAWLSTLHVVAGAGIQSWLVVAVSGARGSYRRALGQALGGSGAAALLLWLLLLLLSPTLRYGGASRGFVLAASLAAVPAAMAWAGDGVLTGSGRPGQGTAGRAAASLVRLAAGVAVLSLGGGITGLIPVIWAAELVGLAVVTLLVLRIPIPQGSREGPSVAASFPYAVQTVLVVVFLRTDTVMLSVIRGETEVGVYAAAYRLVEAGFLASGALGVVALHRLSAGTDRFDRLLRETTRLAGLSGLIVAVLLTGVATGLVRLVFGAQFGHSGQALSILGAAAFPHFLNTVLARALWARDRVWWSVRVAATNVALNVALNLALIPRWGAVGAAVATVATLVVAVGHNLWLLVKCERVVPVGVWLLRGTAAAGLTFLLVRWVAHWAHPAWALAAPVVFCLLLIILGERRSLGVGLGSGGRNPGTRGEAPGS